MGTVLALIAAEVQSLAGLRDATGGDPWLTCIGLAWGFAVIGLVALRGTGRPRVTAEIEIVEELEIAGQSEPGVLLRVALSNEFGDREVEPLLNILIGPDPVAYDWDPQRHCPGDRFELPLSAPVAADGRTIECRYHDKYVGLSAGDVAVSFTLLPSISPETLVVVRLDHVDFRGGRVQRAAWLRPGPSIEGANVD